MRKVNLYEAKTHLSRLVDDALAGEEIVIARSGKPLVRLTPWRAEETPRRPGGAKVRLAPDFDAPLDGELGAAFRGERP
jgi:prevent-host-death family protein